MKAISRDELLQLINATGDYFVSLYMPIELAPGQRPQNLVRCKNLLRTAEEALIANRMRSPEARALLAPGRKLLDEAAVWTSVSHGLAIFLSREGMRVWHLPFACEELCMVGPRFHVMPLLAWLTEDMRYYVLAVSQNRVKLMHGSRYELEEVAVPNLPANLHEALNYEPRDGGFQTHSGLRQLRGKESMVFHGQGGEADAAKEELVSYFRMIDRPVADFLRPQSEPLLFAGVDYLFPLYREVNTYSHLLPTFVAGNPDIWSPTEIQQRAWPLLESLLRDRREAELAKYWNYVAHSRTLNRVEDIVPAAQTGGVETLFVVPKVRRLGSFSPESAAVRLNDPPQPDSEDLVNLAATLVLGNHGAVETVTSGNIPGGGAMAAVTRYPLPLHAT